VRAIKTLSLAVLVGAYGFDATNVLAAPEPLATSKSAETAVTINVVEGTNYVVPAGYLLSIKTVSYVCSVRVGTTVLGLDLGVGFDAKGTNGLINLPLPSITDQAASTQMVGQGISVPFSGTLTLDGVYSLPQNQVGIGILLAPGGNQVNCGAQIFGRLMPSS
jgi:hypothetical protein